MKISSEEILDQMKDAVELVFTTMMNTVATLVECNSSDEPNEEGDTVAVEAVVAFSGAPSGAVVLRATMEGATDIARRLLMMGEDEAVDLEEIQDALGECANMVTGTLKTRALDPRGTFHLGTPVISTMIHVEPGYQTGRLVFELCQGNVAVEIWLSEETDE